ncbi:MAG: formylmethanofuran dehydrogenase [Hyphomicrobiaceae bacterium]|nr:formylmethanofuran dehydrogenase [Hyphomicrobiaceae bacterium]
MESQASNGSGLDTFTSVTCPFCGLHCDDLEVRNSSGADAGHLTIARNGCERAARGFERRPPPSSPQIGGRDTDLATALATAARLIGGARLPLYGGLGTDVEGVRAIMALADRSGGVVDHHLSAAIQRNMGVLQTQGWIMSTLTETRNRADLVIVVASDLMTLHPRFFERIVAPAEAMFGGVPSDRTVVLVGDCGHADAITRTGVKHVVEIPSANDDIPVVLGVLRSMLKGTQLPARDDQRVPFNELADLALRCKRAEYGVFVWAPQALAFRDGDLAVQIVTDIVRDINKTTRFAGLSLGGNDGAASAASVCSWQSGYPLRVSFASGAPDYDPYRYDIRRMLEAGEGDLLVWTASFDPEAAPPATGLPLIALATPGMRFSREPDVLIPVGTPGLDHSGRLVRCDSVVSLPLRQLRPSRLASVTEIANAIAASL